MAPLALPRKAIKCGEDRGRGVLFESYDHLHIMFFKTTYSKDAHNIQNLGVLIITKIFSSKNHYPNFL